LPDATLGGEVSDHTAEKRPVIARYRRDIGNRFEKPLGRFTIGREIVLAAE
jgi:hypothetical protein